MLRYPTTTIPSRHRLYDRQLLANQRRPMSVAGLTTPETYGAVGDGVLKSDGAMSTGSAILTSATSVFTQGDVGKDIGVNGAGAAGVPLITTILSVQSATQVTLASANASGGNVTGTIFYYGTDDTISLQAAIDAIADSGGGTLLFGEKIYCITAELVLPDREIQNEQVVLIEFKGTLGPIRSNWNNTNEVIGGDNDVKLPILGQTIIQLIANIAGTKMFDCNWVTPASQIPSGVQVYIDNMVWRVPPKLNVSGIDLRHVYSCRLIDVTIEPSDYQSNLAEPVAGGIGLRLPRVGNGAQVIGRRIGIAGFDTGYRHSEHADLDDIWVYRCKFPAAIEAGNHVSKYGRITFHACPNGIAATTDETAGLAYLTCQELNVEDSIVGGGHWSAPLNHILDPSNNLRGHIWHHKVVGFVGQEDGITKFGGANLITQQIGRRLLDGGVAGIGELPFDCALTAPIGEAIPPEENTGQEWMLRTGVTMEVFNADGVYFDTGNGTCIARLEATVEDYRVEVRVDIDALQVRCNAGVCLKYIQGGHSDIGGTYIAAVIQIMSGVNRLRLIKVTNGTAVELDSDTSIVFAAGNDYKLWVDYNGGGIEVFVDEVSKCTATLSADDIAIFGRSRQFGLYSFVGPDDDDRQTQWRNLAVTAL